MVLTDHFNILSSKKQKENDSNNIGFQGQEVELDLDIEDDPNVLTDNDKDA